MNDFDWTLAAQIAGAVAAALTIAAAMASFCRRRRDPLKSELARPHEGRSERETAGTRRQRQALEHFDRRIIETTIAGPDGVRILPVDRRGLAAYQPDDDGAPEPDPPPGGSNLRKPERRVPVYILGVPGTFAAEPVANLVEELESALGARVIAVPNSVTFTLARGDWDSSGQDATPVPVPLPDEILAQLPEEFRQGYRDDDRPSLPKTVELAAAQRAASERLRRRWRHHPMPPPTGSPSAIVAGIRHLAPSKLPEFDLQIPCPPCKPPRQTQKPAFPENTQRSEASTQRDTFVPLDRPCADPACPVCKHMKTGSTGPA